MRLFTRLERGAAVPVMPEALAGGGEAGPGMSPGMRLRLAISGRAGRQGPLDAGSLVDLDRRPDDVAWLIVRAISARAA